MRIYRSYCSLLFKYCLCLFELLGLVDSLLLIFHGFKSSSFIIRSEHMLRSSNRILYSFRLLATVTLLTTFEVVVLTLRALPPTIWKLETMRINSRISFNLITWTFLDLIHLLFLIYFNRLLDRIRSHWWFLYWVNKMRVKFCITGCKLLHLKRRENWIGLFTIRVVWQVLRVLILGLEKTLWKDRAIFIKISFLWVNMTVRHVFLRDLELAYLHLLIGNLELSWRGRSTRIALIRFQTQVATFFPSQLFSNVKFNDIGAQHIWCDILIIISGRNFIIARQ